MMTGKQSSPRNRRTAAFIVEKNPKELFVIEIARKPMRTIDYRLRDNLRRRLQKTLKDIPRTKKAHELLGCGIPHFKRHLERQFTDGMSWDNYGGIDGWEVDHILPLVNLDMTKLSQQKKGFHYKNTRPLWSIDNKRRKKKLINLCIPE